MNTRQIAVSYIKTLSGDERKSLAEMLAHGVPCGADFARKNGITPEQMSAGLLAILKEE
ncbi:hypothetical protein [uncultured Treponema sp.]|uniref:hypothetical protein n=1 Tax=uncultured Treponema sp. TaxID=162155 RepID=UPI00280BD90F|nr:hypothetical protein [uncultured Treponema sp.]